MKCTCCFPFSDNLDASSTQKLLMKTGLILIVIGHLNFITGALVHGTVLRHIANPQDTISLQYAISNIIIVISAIVTISCGIAAIALSRYASQKLLRWAVLSFSTTSALLSLFCAVGLVVAIAATFANKGRALLAVCTFADMDFIQIAHECPFDPTRVYVSLPQAHGMRAVGCGAGSRAGREQSSPREVALLGVVSTLPTTGDPSSISLSARGSRGCAGLFGGCSPAPQMGLP
uniref:Transmembrane protein 54 n=1 Tax=Varanus komodoensis TaxID=61221 RepID=A0A8D2J259_VARKO